MTEYSNHPARAAIGLIAYKGDTVRTGMVIDYADVRKRNEVAWTLHFTDGSVYKNMIGASVQYSISNFLSRYNKGAELTIALTPAGRIRDIKRSDGQRD